MRARTEAQSAGARFPIASLPALSGAPECQGEFSQPTPQTQRSCPARPSPAQPSPAQQNVKLACRVVRDWFLRGLLHSLFDGGLSRRIRSAIGHRRARSSSNSREQGDDFHPEGCPLLLEALSLTRSLVALLIVAALPCSAPAYRAMRVNPIVALEYQ